MNVNTSTCYLCQHTRSINYTQVSCWTTEKSYYFHKKKVDCGSNTLHNKQAENNPLNIELKQQRTYSKQLAAVTAAKSGLNTIERSIFGKTSIIFSALQHTPWSSRGVNTFARHCMVRALFSWIKKTWRKSWVFCLWGGCGWLGNQISVVLLG